MRIKNSVYNIVSNLVIILLQTVLLFLVRIFFVKTLNVEYLGVQGLFNNIISMLSLADLGISMSICFSLYEPLAKKDYVKISSIMSFFRKIYWILAGIIVLIGFTLTPFIHFFAKDYTMGNLEIIFLIYIFLLAVEYFLNYKEIIIFADQKKYKLTKINVLFTFLIYIMQIVILVVFKNFIFYLLIELVFKTFKLLLSNIYITKYYPEVNFYSKKKIDKNVKNGLKKNVKGLLFFRIGDYLVNGTDNIIISKCINISSVGIYGNYLSVISVLKNITNNIIEGMTSSFGNLVVLENEQTQENVFKIMDYINFVIVGYFFVCIIQLLNKFIILCFGSNYLLSIKNMVIICINFYLVSIMASINAVKNASGLYYEDRYSSIFQAIINLVLSLVLVRYIGLTGVLLGTTFSYILWITWERPYIIYKKIFKTSFHNYMANFIKRIVLILFIVVLNYFIFKALTLPNSILGFIATGCICTAIYVLVIGIYSYNKNEFRYLLNMIQNNFKKQKI